MSFRKEVGNSVDDLDKLAINDMCCVVIPHPQPSSSERTMMKDLEPEFNMIKDQVLHMGSSVGKKYSVEMNIYGGAVVHLYGFSYSRLVKYALQQLDNEHPDEPVDVLKITGQRSEVSAIYAVAKEQKIKITISEYPKYYEVCLRKKVKLATVRGRNVSLTLNQWILQLAYDTPSALPDAVTEVMSDAYIRTILNKSMFECKYIGGKVTKLSFSMCNRGGGVEIRTTGKTLARVKDTKITDLTEHHRRYLNLQLMPHGVSVVGRKVINTKELEHV